ncbi:MAG: hypothetical protein ACI4XF_04480 [Oscillospiraceae bacterium]
MMFSVGDPISPSWTGNRSYTDHYLFDRIIRAAASGIDADTLKELLGELDVFSEKIHNDQLYLLTELDQCKLMLQQIIILHSDSDCLNTFFECRKKKNSDDYFSVPNYNRIFDFTHSMLLTACFCGSDEVLSSMIAEIIEKGMFGLNCSLFNALYFLMISGRYPQVKLLIEKYTEKWRTRVPDTYQEKAVFSSECFTLAAASAAIFGNDDFLSEMFSAGYIPDLPELFSCLAPFPDAIEHLIGKFYRQMGYDGTEPPSFEEFVSQVMNDKVFRLCYEIYKKNDEATALRYAQRLPPISRLIVSEAAGISGFVFDHAYEKIIEICITDEVTLVFDDPCCTWYLNRIKTLFGDRTVTIDLSAACPDFNYFNIKELKYLLSCRLILPKSEDTYKEMLRSLLLLDSRPLTKLLIDKNIINSENYLECAGSCAEAKDLRALDVISKKYIGG